MSRSAHGSFLFKEMIGPEDDPGPATLPMATPVPLPQFSLSYCPETTSPVSPSLPHSFYQFDLQYLWQDAMRGRRGG
jgi:hypothetical protein